MQGRDRRRVAIVGAAGAIGRTATLSRILQRRVMPGLRVPYSEVVVRRVERAITKMTIKINYSHRGLR